MRGGERMFGAGCVSQQRRRGASRARSETESSSSKRGQREETIVRLALTSPRGARASDREHVCTMRVHAPTPSARPSVKGRRSLSLLPPLCFARQSKVDNEGGTTHHLGEMIEAAAWGTRSFW